MLSGDWLGAYCLSEPQAGSDVAAIRTRAVRDGDDYVLTGGKAWISHAGHADFYTTFVRTSDDGGRGLSCFHVPAGVEGLTVATSWGVGGVVDGDIGVWRASGLYRF